MNAITTQQDYRTAIAAAEQAAAAYYDDADLVMDDGEYDELVAAIAAAEAANPAWGASAVTTSVAAGVSRGGDIAHSAPMLSLDNAFDDGELAEWHTRMLKVVGLDSVALCVEPKLDGLALAARYEHGKLVMAVTRGDGETGEDVTAQARYAAGLPHDLGENLTFEIRGEVVMTAAQFETANTIRIAEGKTGFANPRNAVAGTIRRKDSTTPLTFCAYGIIGHGNTDMMDHSELMEWLAGLGVNTAIAMGAALNAGRCETLAQAAQVCATIAERRADLDCGIDGAVVKADAPAVRANAGSTGKAPRWAIARKFPPDTKTTKLLGIECAVGRTGALTVRAELAPVSVGGVVITSCTLSNPSEIARKDLRIGDIVFVRRAGEVIPEITAVQLSERADDAEAWQAPTECPSCGSTLDQSQKVWRCVQGNKCGLTRAIEYACSRDALDIEGMGSRLVQQLVERGDVESIADLFTLTKDQLLTLDRMGDVSATKVLAQIELAKSQPMSRVFTALGLRSTGRRMCKRIAVTFPSLQAFRSASVDELAAVEGIGDVRASTIVSELAKLADVCDRLVAMSVGVVEEPAAAASGGALAGKKVCVTGSVPGHTRDSAHAFVEALGGTVVSSVSSKTDLLVVGDGGGSKAKKAEQLGIKTISGAELVAMG
jgi:DNA ligase (NAD+)